jgi:hypothetical protein
MRRGAPFAVNRWKLMANESTMIGSIALMRDAEFKEVIGFLAPAGSMPAH